MDYYRLYFMSGFSGHIESFVEFEAEDDAAATALAQTHRGALALELWCSHRKVARLEAIDLASQLIEQRRVQRTVKARAESGPRSGKSPTRNRST